MKVFMTTIALGILAVGLAGCKIQTGDVTNGNSANKDAPAATEPAPAPAPTPAP